MNTKLLKPEVRKLYLDGKDVTDIIKLFPSLNQSTIYNWIKKDNWSTIRDSKLSKYTNAPELLLEMLYKMFEQLGEDLKDSVKTAKNSDAILKIIKSYKSLWKEGDRLSSVIFTVGEMIKYLNKTDNAQMFEEVFRDKMEKFLIGFQNLMIEKYSPNNLN